MSLCTWLERYDATAGDRVRLQYTQQDSQQIPRLRLAAIMQGLPESLAQARLRLQSTRRRLQAATPAPMSAPGPGPRPGNAGPAGQPSAIPALGPTPPQQAQVSRTWSPCDRACLPRISASLVIRALSWSNSLRSRNSAERSSVLDGLLFQGVKRLLLWRGFWVCLACGCTSALEIQGSQHRCLISFTWCAGDAV